MQATSAQLIRERQARALSRSRSFRAHREHSSKRARADLSQAGGSSTIGRNCAARMVSFRSNGSSRLRPGDLLRSESPTRAKPLFGLAQEKWKPVTTRLSGRNAVLLPR